MASNIEYCLLFQLPIELRLQIYKYTIASGTYTISSAPSRRCKDTAGHPSPDRLIPGVPLGHDIVVGQGYVNTLALPPNTKLYGRRSSLDSVQKIIQDVQKQYEIYDDDHVASFVSTVWAGILEDSKSTPGGLAANLHDNLASLHLTCRAIHLDLVVNRINNSLGKGNLDLLLSFPAGVCIVADQFPHVLPLVKTMNIAGCYELNTSGEEAIVARQAQARALAKLLRVIFGKKAADKAAALYAAKATAQEPTHTTNHTSNNSIDDLNNLSAPYPSSNPKILSPADPSSPTLNMRIFHPKLLPFAEDGNHDDDLYPHIWQDWRTPLDIAMSTIYGGVIATRNYRLRSGMGFELLARGNSGGRREHTHSSPKVKRGWEWWEWCLSGWEEGEG